MASDSAIEWTDKTWNVLRGCSRVSPGCGGAAGEGGCYAERQAHRFSGKGKPYEGLTVLRNQGPRWTGEVRYIPEMLTQPLRWKKHRRVFVNSMSDVFHEKVEVNVIDGIFAVMAICEMHETIPSHTFQILTKRAERMRDYMRAMPIEAARIVLSKAGGALMEDGDTWADQIAHHMPWPLPNVLLGVSVENQKYADERMPMLCDTPGMRFVSYEPALGPVDFSPWLKDISWLICGGESGPGARPFHYGWAESVITQCQQAQVPCFMKQVGAQPMLVDAKGIEYRHLKDSKGGDPTEWPDWMRVRQWPEARK